MPDAAPPHALTLTPSVDAVREFWVSGHTSALHSHADPLERAAQFDRMLAHEVARELDDVADVMQVTADIPVRKPSNIARQRAERDIIAWLRARAAAFRTGRAPEDDS